MHLSRLRNQDYTTTNLGRFLPSRPGLRGLRNNNKYSRFYLYIVHPSRLYYDVSFLHYVMPTTPELSTTTGKRLQSLTLGGTAEER